MRRARSSKRSPSSGTGSFLAVLKRCGDVALAGPAVVSAARAPRSRSTSRSARRRNIALFATLDAIVREAGGRLYPAKDAHMPGADFRAAYPQWQQLEALRDPAMLSRFWERMIKS